MIDFKRMRDLIRDVPEMLWKVEVASANAARVTANITGMPHGGGMNRQEDGIIRFVEVHEAYLEAEAELKGMQAELKPLLDELENDTGKAIMRMRYLQGLCPMDITDKLVESGKRITVDGVYYHLHVSERIINRLQQNR